MIRLSSLLLATLLTGCTGPPALVWSQAGKMSEYSGIVTARWAFPINAISWPRLSLSQRTTLPHAGQDDMHWPTFPEN